MFDVYNFVNILSFKVAKALGGSVLFAGVYVCVMIMA